MEYVGGNRLTLLKNGEEYFPALIAAIDAARSEVFLESYIYADDETGARVTEALARAAARGVSVHLLVDGFGAGDFARRFRDRLEAARAQLLVFRPEIARMRLRRGRLRRMHRKLAAIDGQLAFVGGINVIDDFESREWQAPRYDYAVRIEGPLAFEVRSAAARLWLQVSWAKLRHRDRAAASVQPPPPCGTQRAALVVRDSLRHRSDIEDAYLQHIEAARVEIVIACAYFLPGRSFRRALREAARRGVRVRLLLQGRVEYFLVHYAMLGLYGRLLDAGVEIYEYYPSFLHAKVAVFDRQVACVGSSNIDPFSLLLAREANVFVDDTAFAKELHDSLEEAMRSGAERMAPRQWHRQPLWRRAWIWIAYGCARFLLSRFGFERYH
ncbi:MAG TPA: cardiolipin synthase ClsB [Burkholderiales bacterium]|nr:cardiolipin synthase ClsB [Burkholderiales bacterium]